MNFPPLEEVQIFSDFLFFIRKFFRERDFLEVETPLLNPFATPEPNIDSFQTGEYFLITSPEFNLKTLLSYYKKNLFQIAHVFRKGDQGKIHRNEFLMLEWYRTGYNHHRIMDEVTELLLYLSENIPAFEKVSGVEKISMKELFFKHLNRDYSRETLIETIKEFSLVDKQKLARIQEEDYEDLFYTVFLSLIEPAMNTETPLFIYDYPNELRAYSKISAEDPEASTRFELFWKSLEIANGYYEITDAEEQKEIFRKELRKRKKLGKPAFPVSKSFLDSFPLPECSGVSIGLERLYLAFRNLPSLSFISLSGNFLSTNLT